VNKNWKTKPNQTFPLKEIEGVEIISLMDNSVDFLSTIERDEVQQVRTWVKEQKGEEWTKEHFRLPMAEHGFSMLIRVFDGRKSRSILFDTGSSPDGVVSNAERMGLGLSEIECIVLSHGHYDHCGGLLATLKVVNKDNLPIIVHEDMFKTRGVANPGGTIRKYPMFPTEKQVKPARYVKTKQPHFIADNMILVTGEIPRKTDFEKGFPQHRVFIDGKWQSDPWIWDERAIVINVRQKGLVVVSGCAHAGIINTILYAQRITGVDDVYAVLGGFHLSGKECEPRISQTVEKLKMLDPKLLAPSHCTGWRGVYAIAKACPYAFVWNSVGNLYQF
jgi:7,8-dihydropterin-6-yl-methyl-4-(beta-D-ribofuranosyl)aminobenzene 5'-phosphate synthase